MKKSGVRLGLCCIFKEEPIKFRVATATALRRLPRDEALQKLASICKSNAVALLQALRFCSEQGIGCFRVSSPILPLRTHPECGYRPEDLPGGAEIEALFRDCGRFAKTHGLRTTFHPDQFILLNSPRPDVVRNSIAELEYQAEVAAWIGADVITIHGGGAYHDKPAALARLQEEIGRLPKAVRSRLALENDDKTFTPEDLLPVCRATAVPLVYDAHHHRCNPDSLSVEEATRSALETWNREPLFHISSPLDGWRGPQPNRHHDYIDVNDFPACWLPLNLTVEVEAKAKELAVRKLQEELRRIEAQSGQ